MPILLRALISARRVDAAKLGQIPCRGTSGRCDHPRHVRETVHEPAPLRKISGCGSNPATYAGAPAHSTISPKRTTRASCARRGGPPAAGRARSRRRDPLRPREASSPPARRVIGGDDEEARALRARTRAPSDPRTRCGAAAVRTRCDSPPGGRGSVRQPCGGMGNRAERRVIPAPKARLRSTISRALKRARDTSRAAIDAIDAVVAAEMGEQDLGQRYAPPVGRGPVAYPPPRGRFTHLYVVDLERAGTGRRVNARVRRLSRLKAVARAFISNREYRTSIGQALAQEAAVTTRFIRAIASHRQIGRSRQGGEKVERSRSVGSLHFRLEAPREAFPAARRERRPGLAQ